MELLLGAVRFPATHSGSMQTRRSAQGFAPQLPPHTPRRASHHTSSPLTHTRVVRLPLEHLTLELLLAFSIATPFHGHQSSQLSIRPKLAHLSPKPTWTLFPSPSDRKSASAFAP